MQNKFFKIDDYSKNKIIFQIKDDVEIDILIVLQNDKNLSLIFEQFNNYNSTKINIGIWSFSNAIVDIKVNTINHNNFQKTNINLYALSYNFSKIKLDCESIVESSKIDSEVHQNIKGLILSNNSSIGTLPNLHINTNQVLATHSVNIGGLDKEELFYLLSKGISYDESINVILNSYFNEIFKSLSDIEKNKEINIIQRMKVNYE